MAQSLNQAFIQAFKKSGPSPQQTEETDTAGTNDFVVRIDTATLSVPEPHFLKRAQKPRPSMPATSVPPDVGMPESKPVTRPAVKTETPAPTPVLESEESAESENGSVRDSIAAQMQQASDLNSDVHFESFFGSEIVTSASSIPAAPERPANTVKAIQQTELETVEALHTEPTAVEPSIKQQSPTAEAGYWEQALGVEEQPSISTAKSESFATQRQRPLNASRPAVFEPQVTPQPPSKVDAPNSPALSPDEVEKIVENYVKKHGNGGEIFRLDRPTYGPDAAGSVTEEPSGDSISFEDQDSWTQLDAAEPTPEEAEAAPVQQLEENLRQAKMRSFNAVWEVDRLQWPAVCQELMDACESSLTQVAINLGKASHEGLQVLAVTSPQAGDGRTTVACCLAKVAATAGLRVAIVDADIENPTLCYQTNLDLEDDWKSAIFQQLPLEEVAVHSLEDQLTVVPLLEPIEDYEIDSDDNRIAFMLQQLSESFDLVIADMGHMDSKRSLVMPMTDQGIVNAVLAVVDHRQTTPGRVEACLRRIRRTGIASIGIVENFAG
ncbi:MAG: AAA family ATPase [Planctomycetota bacterium]